MGKLWDRKEYANTARRAAAEGIVLLKNDREALPLKEGTGIALFGRSQFHYYNSGTGSGGSVNTDYVVGIYEALEGSGRFKLNASVRGTYEAWVKDHPFDAGAGWGQEPWSQEEMPLKDDLVGRASKESEAAIFIIGRTAGEDQDSRNEPGSFLLTETEEEAIGKLCAAFEKTVVILNTGNIIDMKWVARHDPASVLYVWQGGQEGGNAVLDVLSGDVDPDGHLTDTIAANVSDYPSDANFGSMTENVQTEDIYVGYRYFETFAKDKVLYPFGFGLSYTCFETEAASFEAEAKKGARIEARVRNTGKCPGRHTVQAYVEAPQGKLGKPARVLVGFAKTGVLKPGEEQILELHLPMKRMASYDDSGKTGHPHAFVMEEGRYVFYLGDDVRSAKEEGSLTLSECIVLKQCEEAAAPVRAFERLVPVLSEEGTREGRESVPLRQKDPEELRRERLPECMEQTGDRGYRLMDVEDGTVSMECFLAQLTDQDLIHMIRGEGMCSAKVTPGIAGAYGGVTERLKSFGIPIAGCADGPSGIRMDCGTHAFSLPNGTCLACSFDEELVEKLFRYEALELRKNQIDALLGPGMNLHRHPLNGRNFEYFSEDPLVSGRIASAELKGLHRCDETGVIKHFAANTQEKSRHMVNAVISERALRELYLKGFEIAVREGGARAVMSTYGPVNGTYTSSDYGLLTTILRKEWGFDGIVMTDWWAQGNDRAGVEGSYQNVSAQVRAQNDLNMVNTDSLSNSGGDDLDSALREGRLTRGELVRSASNICRHLLDTPAYLRSVGRQTELDRELAASLSEEDAAVMNRIYLEAEGAETEIDPSLIDTGKGKNTVFNVNTPHRASFDLELALKAEEGISPMAQLPISIFMNKDLMLSLTLNGGDKDWKEVRVRLPGSYQTGYTLKFFFGQSGLRIRSARLVMVEDLEEKMVQAMKNRRES